MRPRRFDTQLQFVFTVLSGLTLLVGLTSIGINRTLIKSHDAVLTQNIAMIRRAERVGSDAVVARSLAAQLASAPAEAEITRLSGDLQTRIAAMEDGILALRDFLGDERAPALPEGAATALVPDMTETARQAVALSARSRAELDRLEAMAPPLAALISAQADLARLRIVAGIWEIYAQPQAENVRPALDRLADRDFFTFERIRELAEATAELARLTRQVSEVQDVEALPELRQQLADALDLAHARAHFLPAPAATASVARDLSAYATALDSGGLIALHADALGARTRLQALSDRLGTELATLSAEAVSRRDATRAEMQQRVSEAGRRAGLLSLALVLALAAALAAGIALWLYARRRIVSRLGAVSERIVSVARGDDPARPMRISGHDEVGRLEKAVNVLRRRTQEAARLRASLEAAVRARTADVVAEMGLANAARAEAEDASRAKTRFLARMSHEIRTPLNGVVGMLHLLETEETDPARRARLATALASAQDLRVLTDDILTFSSGEDASPVPARTAFDPALLARHLGEHLHALAIEKGLRPVVAIAPGLPPALSGEPLRIRQVVGNLISNAVKYTVSGEVRLDVTHQPADSEMLEMTFSVTDTGPGMTAQETLRAFDIYGRTDAARRRGIQGVGLGLAIARQLTDAMGGELRVSSEPGRGSRFSLTLRLAAADPGDLLPDEGPILAPLAQRVLVVDDHPVNRLVARGYLERMGCIVTEAGTGAEALDLARSETFDAILIDLDLPDMHGTDVIARLDRKAARIAVLTADLVADDTDTRQRFGVGHVLTKPIAPRALLAVLTDHVAPTEPTPGDDTEAMLRQDRDELGEVTTAEIVASFLEDLPALVARILSAEGEDRRRAAHKLKGASANFGLHRMGGMLQRVQSGDDTAVEMLPGLAAEAERAVRGAADRLGLRVAAGGAQSGQPM